MRRARAMEVLRRPGAAYSVSAMLDGKGQGCLESVHHARLGLVVVLLTAIDAEFGQNLAAKAVVRDHAPDGKQHELLRTAGANAAGCLAVVTADKAGKPVVNLFGLFLAGEDHFLGIDHDNMVAV